VFRELIKGDDFPFFFREELGDQPALVIEDLGGQSRFGVLEVLRILYIFRCRQGQTQGDTNDYRDHESDAQKSDRQS